MAIAMISIIEMLWRSTIEMLSLALQVAIGLSLIRCERVILNHGFIFACVVSLGKLKALLSFG
jgi:hypothetical protein